MDIIIPLDCFRKSGFPILDILLTIFLYIIDLYFSFMFKRIINSAYN